MENGVGFALLHRRRTQLLGRCEEFVKTMAHFVANRCHTPERSQRSDTARSCRHSIGAASLPLGPGLVPRAAGRGEALRRSRSGGLTWRSEILAWRGSRRKSGRAPCRKLVVDLSARWGRTPSTLRPGETTQPHVVARPGPSRNVMEFSYFKLDSSELKSLSSTRQSLNAAGPVGSKPFPLAGRPDAPRVSTSRSIRPANDAAPR